MENLEKNYKIIADYHTHTVYSHGKGSVEDNVKKAIEIGLKTIAITDHGLKHFIFGVSKNGLKKQIEEINNLKIKYPQINILSGIEGNLCGISGATDITKEIYDNVDIILCGFHKPVWSDKFSDYYKLYYNSYSHPIYKPTKSQIARNTKAYVNMVKNNKIDILTHINYHLKVDCKEVAKVCADYGTAIELSSRHNECTDSDYEALFAVDELMLAVNSDAHKVENIGNCTNAMKVIKKYKIDARRIINCEASKFELHSRK